MKQYLKVGAVVTGVLFSFFSGTARAASVGLAPTQPGPSVSVEYTHVFDQELEEQTTVKNLEIDESQALLARINYAFTEYHSLYVKMGMANLQSKLTTVSGTNRLPYNLKYDFGFAWAVGGQVTFPIRESGVRAHFGFQYLRWESSVDSVRVNNAAASSLSASDATVSDVGISAIASKDLVLGNGNTLTPYLGVKLSSVKVDYGTVRHAGVTVGSTTFLGFSGDVKSENHVGIIVGAEYDITEDISLNVEGRFIDETAATGSLRYRF